MHEYLKVFTNKIYLKKIMSWKLDAPQLFVFLSKLIWRTFFLNLFLIHLWFCTSWKIYFYDIFLSYYVKNPAKSFQCYWNCLKWSKWDQNMPIKYFWMLFFRKSRLFIPILFTVTCYFLCFLLSKKICPIFVGKNKVTRDFCLTPEHYWEGS